MNLYYQDIQEISGFASQANFNGTISGTTWSDAVDNTPHGYGYSYDELNRITKAQYAEKPVDWQASDKYSVPLIDYDENGNIMHLQRNGADAQLMDNLTYNYLNEGNQLASVTDATSNPEGFFDGNTQADDYDYDANGNLRYDNNKNITSIEYNLFNLVNTVEYANGDVVSYMYNSAGRKLRYTDETGKVTDYAGRFVYKDNELKYFFIKGGRVLVESSNIEYEYYLGDNLGNTRAVFTVDENTGNLTIRQIASYYPYGLRHTSASADDATQPYLYNGKELQGATQWYDYGFRMYDAQIGRFHIIDPQSECTSSLSNYTYAFDNPINYIDWMGLAGTLPMTQSHHPGLFPRPRKRGVNDYFMRMYNLADQMLLEEAQDMYEAMRDIQNQQNQGIIENGDIDYMIIFDDETGQDYIIGIDEEGNVVSENAVNITNEQIDPNGNMSYNAYSDDGTVGYNVTVNPDGSVSIIEVGVMITPSGSDLATNGGGDGLERNPTISQSGHEILIPAADNYDGPTLNINKYRTRAEDYNTYKQLSAAPGDPGWVNVITKGNKYVNQWNRVNNGDTIVHVWQQTDDSIRYMIIYQDTTGTMHFIPDQLFPEYHWLWDY